MRWIPFALACLAVVARSAGVESAPISQETRSDSARQIREDFETLGREYASFMNPTDAQLSELSDKLLRLRSRCARLGGKDVPELRVMMGVIAESLELIQQRAKIEAERRKNEPKPYSFRPISSPSFVDGGHSERGISYLWNEVEEFTRRYRATKRGTQPSDESPVILSRAYFRRTIDQAIDTATRQLKSNQIKVVAQASAKAELAYDHYSPIENLRWALAVSRMAVYFEERIGGSGDRWREAQAKILALAAEYRLSIE